MFYAMFLLVSEGIIAKFLDADFASVSGVVTMSKRVLFFLGTGQTWDRHFRPRVLGPFPCNYVGAGPRLGLKSILSRSLQLVYDPVTTTLHV